jgi:cyclopropane fatty-acyl-phospholipid synthase-like methyltransferase
MSLAPFVPSPPDAVTAMLQLADVKKDEVLFDLGCGDGRIIIEAAQKFGAKAVGVELDKIRYEECVRRIRESNLDGRVNVIHGNLLDVDLTSANIVTLYLLTSSNEKLRPKLEKELKNGTRVVSHKFPISKWKPSEVKEINKGRWISHKIYLYIMQEETRQLSTPKTQRSARSAVFSNICGALRHLFHFR